MKNIKIFKLLLILLLSVTCLIACNDSQKTVVEQEKTPVEDVKTPTTGVTPTPETPVVTPTPETPEKTPTPVVEYTVVFKNYDGTVLYTTTVEAGKTAEYVGTIPTKPAEGYIEYVFNGWNSSLTNVSKDLEVTAVYRTVDNTPKEIIDYAGTVKLDLSSETYKEEVTVKLFVDGDTTHFNISSSTFDESLLKARYLAVNTPESTGKVEPWGKTAAKFTKEKLSNAVSIIIESDNASWEADSTGGRYLVWVWYKSTEDSDYRNLNIELLQEGLAIASNSEQNRYGQICGEAIAQARREKLKVYSSQQDPNFYYGEAQELTLKELRTNIEQYEGQKVAFEGVVFRDYSQTVYVEEYDEETGVYYGMTVYYGFGASGNLLEILAVGNRVRIVGTVSIYEAAGTYQVSGLSYRTMKPNDPSNSQKISDGHSGAYTKLTAEEFANKKIFVSQETEEGTEEKEYDLAELILNSSVSMDNLKVVSAYTTTNEDSSSKGAMTLTCEVDGIKVTLRTVVLYDESGNIITQDAYLGKTISVKGMVEYFSGDYQIKIFSASDITIH